MCQHYVGSGSGEVMRKCLGLLLVRLHSLIYALYLMKSHSQKHPHGLHSTATWALM